MIYWGEPEPSILPTSDCSGFQDAVLRETKHIFDKIQGVSPGERALGLGERPDEFARKSLLYPFQMVPVLYFCDYYTSVVTSDLKGLLLFFNMGTGKTYTSIACAGEYCVRYPHYKRVVVFLKSGLIQPWLSSVRRFAKTSQALYPTLPNFEFIPTNTIQMTQIFVEKVQTLRNCVVILEESHNFVNALNNSSTNAVFAFKQFMKANCKVLFLSGTPIINNCNELAYVINICKDSKDPRDPRAPLFDTKKFSMESYSEKYICNRMFGIVAFSEGSVENYPQLLPMQEIYCEFTDKERSDQAVILAMLKKRNADIITVKDTALLTVTFCDDKRRKLKEELLKFKAHKQIVYTNYTTQILPLVSALLTETGLEFKIISGDVSFDERRAAQRAINANPNPMVVVLTSVGAEGLNFVCMRVVHIVEPYWYHGRLLQIIY